MSAKDAPIRVLIDATAIPPAGMTGAARYVHLLVGALVEHGEIAFDAFGFGDNPFESLPDARYRSAPLLTFAGPIAREISRRRFVRRLVPRYDVVHFSLEPAPVRRAASVLTLFDLSRLTAAYRRATRGSALRAALRTRLRYGGASGMTRIVTTSNASREDIAARLGMSRDIIDVHMIPPDACFSPGAPDAEALRRAGIPDAPYILFVGELGRQKNELGLARAFAAARSSGGVSEDTRLVLAGNAAALSERDRAWLAIDARIVLAGAVTDADLVHLYRGARLVALPSLAEGYGLPVVEAMACGVPVVVSDAGSLPEIAGDAGLVVRAGDDRDLAVAIARIVSDSVKRDDLVRRGLARARAFGQEGMARGHIATYRAAHDAYTHRQPSGTR